MPTIIREDGFAVRIYTNDHRPMHVHVIKAAKEVVIELGEEDIAPSVRENYGMRSKDELRALLLVGDNQALLISEWKRIHG